MTNVEKYTAADYRNGMPPRAFGSETEFTDTGNLMSLHHAYQEAHGMISNPMGFVDFMDKNYVVGRSYRTDNFDIVTVNGGRLYLDSDGVEFATPECRTPQELVLHERAGEVIAYDSLQRAALFMGDAAVKMYKRSGYAHVYINGKLTIREDSIGHHENYTSLNKFSLTSDNSLKIKRLRVMSEAKYLADFLALRKLIDGVGMVDVDGYSISQRPRAVNFRDFTEDTKHGAKRPFFQHGDRLEVRSGEGNKSDWATEFKFGLTSLVLRLIEHNKFPKHIALRSPYDAVGHLSREPLGDVVLVAAKKRKGIDALKEIVDEAVELAIQFPEFPAYEQKAAVDFYKFYDDLHNVSLKDHDVSALSDRIDWAARFEYLVGRGATYDTITTVNPGQVRDDLKWDEIGERDIARRHFSKFGHTMLKAQVLGPPPTRAQARVKVVRELSKAGDVGRTRWDSVIADSGKHYVFDNPLEAGSVSSFRIDTLGTPAKDD